MVRGGLVVLENGGRGVKIYCKASLTVLRRRTLGRRCAAWRGGGRGGGRGATRRTAASPGTQTRPWPARGPRAGARRMIWVRSRILFNRIGQL